MNDKKKEKKSGDYTIKEMLRSKDKVVTPHGVFNIVKHDPERGDLRSICYNCFYKNRKVSGASCVEGKWCGDLHSSLEPSTLTQKGLLLQEDTKVKTATKIAAR
jgi:hypothetical protein